MTDTTTEKGAVGQIDDLITDLFAARSFILEHPGLEVQRNDSIHTQWNIPAWSPEELADKVRALASGAAKGSVEKYQNENFAGATRKFGSVVLDVWATRGTVCERRVIGTETVEIPDPEAEVPTITVEREVVEWDCKPLLDVEAVTS